MQQIQEGNVDLVFRRWKRQMVKSGGSQITHIGVIRFTEVVPIQIDDVTEDDAKRSGSSLQDLLKFLNSKEGTIYRITLNLEGEDPRIALRSNTEFSDEEFDHMVRKLLRMDKASKHGPWTLKTLKVIKDKPATRAQDLADELGYEKPWFKLQVRKLKNMGLTISLGVGYEISPRGKEFLARYKSEN